MLSFSRKRTTVEQNYGATEIVGRAGVQVYVNIAFGFPDETRQEALETIELCMHIQRVSQATISPAYFTPYPGNALREESIKQGLSLIHKNECYRYGRDKIKGVDYDFLDALVGGCMITN